MASIPFLSNKESYDSVPDAESLDDDKQRNSIEANWHEDPISASLKSSLLFHLGINILCAALCAAGLYFLGVRISFGDVVRRDNILLPLELRE